MVNHFSAPCCEWLWRGPHGRQRNSLHFAVEMPQVPQSRTPQLGLLVQAPCARISAWLHLLKRQGPNREAESRIGFQLRSLTRVTRVIFFQLDVEAPNELAKPGQSLACKLLPPRQTREPALHFLAQGVAPGSPAILQRWFMQRATGISEPCPAAGRLIGLLLQ